METIVNNAKFVTTWTILPTRRVGLLTVILCHLLALMHHIILLLHHTPHLDI